MRRSDNSHIDTNRLLPSQTFELTLLQDAQEFYLCRQWQLRNFIQKDRSMIRAFESPAIPSSSSSECALLMTKEFAFDKVLRQGSAINDHKWLARTLRKTMDSSREQLFSGARLSAKEHCRVVMCNQVCALKHASHGLASRNDTIRLGKSLKFLSKILSLMVRGRRELRHPFYHSTIPCVGICDTACVDDCPVDCIHGPTSLERIRKISPEERPVKLPGIQMFVDPNECIGCWACVPACPVNAMFDRDDVPEEWQHYVTKNAKFFESGHGESSK
jgi:ferredoxin